MRADPGVDFDALTLDELRRRRSAKWQVYGPDVLPLWVAELDVPLLTEVRDVLRTAVDDGDTGYCAPDDLGRAFAGFAARHWAWPVDPQRCWPVPDVMTGVGEALAVLTSPGDGVVVCPPVYAPFFSVAERYGRRGVPVPLLGRDLDLAGIDVALAGGARAVLLCSPHNPLGRVWTADELRALSAVLRRHDAVLVSDEIHAPLTMPGVPFTPALQVVDCRAVAVVSASKAFNLAGLKAALVVAGDDAVQERLADVPEDVSHKLGHLGVLAGIAAYDSGDAWLGALLAHLDRNRHLVADLVREHLPSVRVELPDASYLSWLDCRAYGDAPAAVFLEQAQVALVEGAELGAPGFVRLNHGTTRAVLEQAVGRLARVAGTAGEPDTVLLADRPRP